MAENESLDLRMSKRWFSVLRAILHGEEAEQISQMILKRTKRAWQKTQQQLLKYGTSLQALIDATIEGKDLGEIYRQTKRHDYVKLFEVEQRPFDSAGQLMERVLCASTERILDQIRDKIIGKDVCQNFGQWKQLKDDWLRPIGGEFEKFAERLANRPNVAVRVADIPVLGDLASPASFVNLSLLNSIPAVHAGAQQ